MTAKYSEYPLNIQFIPEHTGINWSSKSSRTSSRTSDKNQIQDNLLDLNPIFAAGIIRLMTHNLWLIFTVISH